MISKIEKNCSEFQKEYITVTTIKSNSEGFKKHFLLKQLFAFNFRNRKLKFENSFLGKTNQGTTLKEHWSVISDKYVETRHLSSLLLPNFPVTFFCNGSFYGMVGMAMLRKRFLAEHLL